jgi:NitT/TauT family transport system substrate-binding protein
MSTATEMIRTIALWAWVWALALTGCRSAQKETVRIAIGTQNTTINCATGGLVIRELQLLEKYLPKEGKYDNVTFEIVWKDFTSGPPLTGEMVAGKLDIGQMADFPSALNGVAFRKQGQRSIYIATLSGSTIGGGNGIVVPSDSPAQSLKDLKGKQISVPFGSAAHGMLLRAVEGLGWDPEKDVSLVAQSPEVGGTSLQAHKIDAHADFVPFAELFPFRGFARKIYDGSTVNVPTSHGVLANAAYAEKYPEIIVAFLKASIEADRLFSAEPEKYSELIHKVAGIEAEVNYMFHGPLGVQTRDFTLKPEWKQGLATAIDTLRLLKRTEATLDVNEFVDDRYIRQAAKELGVDYDARLRNYDKLPLTGKDARTGEPLADPKLVAQIWISGEEKVRNYASSSSAFSALKSLEAEGKKARVVYVHDRNTGVKLFADKAFYVKSGDDVAISAFLLKEHADAWVKAHGGTTSDFATLTGTPATVGAAIR